MNWINIISDLLSIGLTQAQIAKSAGVSQPTIAGLLAGDQKDMKWANGNKLASFHKKSMREALRKPRRAVAPELSQQEVA